MTVSRPAAHYNLGLALASTGAVEEAIESYRRAIQADSRFAPAYHNLGNLLMTRGSLDESEACFRAATAARPNWAVPIHGLGNALKEMGFVEEAVACYRAALAIDPSLVQAGDALVYALIFLDSTDAETLRREHRLWCDRHVSTIKPSTVYANDRSPDRRLRIGYVSPDFRRHPVGSHLLALLRAHDTRRFEIFCYSDVERAATR